MEEVNDKKIIEIVGLSIYRVKCFVYVEYGLDFEVVVVFDNSEGLEFDFVDEFEDDFIVFVNNNLEGLIF